MVYFKLTFIKDERFREDFIFVFLLTNCLIAEVLFVAKAIFPSLSFFAALLKISLAICTVTFLGFLFYFIDLCVYLCASTILV